MSSVYSQTQCLVNSTYDTTDKTKKLINRIAHWQISLDRTLYHFETCITEKKRNCCNRTRFSLRNQSIMTVKNAHCYSIRKGHVIGERLSTGRRSVGDQLGTDRHRLSIGWWLFLDRMFMVVKRVTTVCRPVGNRSTGIIGNDNDWSEISH